MGKASQKRKEQLLVRQLDAQRRKAGYGNRIIKFNHVAEGILNRVYYNRLFDLITESETLDESVVIFCNQVAKFYYDTFEELYINELQYDDTPPDYENIYWRERISKVAPPFNMMFLEFRTDGWAKSRITGWPKTAGAFIEVTEGEEADNWKWLLKISAYSYDPLSEGLAEIFGKEDPTDDLWLLMTGLSVSPFTFEKSSSPLLVFLNADGHIIDINNPNGKLRYEFEYCEDVWWIALLTLMFINCRNISLVDDEVPTLANKNKSGEKQKRTYYKVLKLRNSYSDQSNSATQTSRDLLPLHMVRGHFATYKDDAPLFGKYTGTFWRPAHIKGSAEHGVVVKDYDVQAPEPS